ncbi:ExbD/TolR family protein [Sulfuriroseicoccus oceanibius]|uniref:Biopolymer transporter ExbD n=1 Tax=Sulfuriroseicoccus oceanibius TaxID=2707525 RepID=A0A6B3LA06_9BACT|nr:biopolymer transporter ExbD [Sulfuriroseicoccus oceanibius]QQL44251.1 biopolymer transporter ExbD [Sulfuriroseicoccus oceanibius]
MRKRTREFGTLSELNITPLLDLAFVLLIIFMITAPLLGNKADLIIPTSTANRESLPPDRVHVVTLAQDGSIDVNGDPTNRESLPDVLSALAATDPGIAVVIQADHRLSVQPVVEVMDALAAVNITKVALVTKPSTD